MGGNASPVVALAFSPNEEGLISANEGGSLKIYDLAEGKISRSLTGHLACVNGVDYHPYGEFVCSGGDDTNVKVSNIKNNKENLNRSLSGCCLGEGIYNKTGRDTRHLYFSNDYPGYMV